MISTIDSPSRTSRCEPSRRPGSSAHRPQRTTGRYATLTRRRCYVLLALSAAGAAVGSDNSTTASARPPRDDAPERDMGALILSSIAFSVGGAFMKPSPGLSRLAPSVAVVACYVVGSVLLTHAVSHRDLSTTYVLGLGVEAVVSIRSRARRARGDRHQPASDGPRSHRPRRRRRPQPVTATLHA